MLPCYAQNIVSNVHSDTALCNAILELLRFKLERLLLPVAREVEEGEKDSGVRDDGRICEFRLAIFA
jgi:hypothetical protein